jgi:lipopolysaccharide/colanic/teichoic acid biosynthesis glycosyltransferase
VDTLIELPRPFRVQMIARSLEAGAGRPEDLANRLFALLLLLLLSPVFVLIALAILCIDGRPVHFYHYRVGQHGRIFRCLKFRTMRRDAADVLAELLRTDPMARAQWQRYQKLTADPRITKVGKFLRKTSLDELPQLVNILRGEMVFVGPRPVTVEELAHYGRVRWHYISVRPGITGLWQVSGRNKTTYERRVELDRMYVESRSLAMDLKILWRTVWVVLSRHGAS